MEKRYDFSHEKDIQKLWEEKKAFKFNGVDERPIYSVDTPPPTVSGKLHVGHIFSFTQSEMIVIQLQNAMKKVCNCYKRSNGYLMDSSERKK